MRADDDEVGFGALRDERLAGVSFDQPALDRHRGLRAEGVGDPVVENDRRCVVLRAQLPREVARGHGQVARIAEGLRWDERPCMHRDEPCVAEGSLLGGEAKRLA